MPSRRVKDMDLAISLATQIGALFIMIGVGYVLIKTDICTISESKLLSQIREFDSCLQFFTNQIAQNVDYINAFEFFYCQICENNCTNMG